MKILPLPFFLKLLRCGIVCTLALAVLTPAARAAEVTLTLHHFLGPSSSTHVTFLEPWARQVERQSGGRIRIEIFPAMTLGGKPAELYRQVRDGAADIVWTLPGYTPGVFPRSEVFELPGVHRGNSRATNLAIQDIFPMIAEDFTGIHPLLVHVHAGNALHLAQPDFTGIESLKGRKLRTPSRTGAWLIESWVAEPVGLPLPALPEALAKGVVDGALVPFEIMPSLNIQQLVRLSVEGPEGRRFGTSVFLFAMNQDRYESLPADLQAVLDANSGIAIAGETGALWDRIELSGKAALQAAGVSTRVLSSSEMTPFDQAGAEMVSRWITESASQPFDGASLAAAARKAVAARTAGLNP